MGSPLRAGSVASLLPGVERTLCQCPGRWVGSKQGVCALCGRGRSLALCVQCLTMKAGASRGASGGCSPVSRAGRPQAMAQFRAGAKQALPTAHTGCASVAQGNIKTHPPVLTRNPGNCPRHLGVNKRFKNLTQGGKLESTMVLELGDLGSLI